MGHHQHGPFVACLWMNDAAPEARNRRVLPDACVDIVWVGSRLVVAGPATGPVVADIPRGTATMGVRFRVGAAGAALGVPAAELLDATVALEDVWGAEGSRITDRVGSAPTPAAGLRALAAAVEEQLARAVEPDAAVRAAALGAEVDLGERQLRRRFAAAVGYGPATLRRILRFQRFLALANPRGATNPRIEGGTDGDGAANPGIERCAGGCDCRLDVDCRRQPDNRRFEAASLDARGSRPYAGAARALPHRDLARLALEAGYADQAHLTRECTRLAGLPPASLLATGARPAGETDSFKTRARPAETLAA